MNVNLKFYLFPLFLSIFFASCVQDDFEEEIGLSETQTMASTRSEGGDDFFRIGHVSSRLGIKNTKARVNYELSVFIDQYKEAKGIASLTEPFTTRDIYPCWECAEPEHLGSLSFYIPMVDVKTRSLEGILIARQEGSVNNTYYLDRGLTNALNMMSIGEFEYWDGIMYYFSAWIEDNETIPRDNLFGSRTFPCIDTGNCVCSANPNLVCIYYVSTAPIASSCDGETCTIEEEDPPSEGSGGGGNVGVEPPYAIATIGIPAGPGSCYFCWMMGGGDSGEGISTGGGGQPASRFDVASRQNMIQSIVEYINEHTDIQLNLGNTLALSNVHHFDYTTYLLYQNIDILSEAEIEAFINLITAHRHFIEGVEETNVLLENAELTNQITQYLSDYEDNHSEFMAHVFLDLSVENEDVLVSCTASNDFAACLEEHVCNHFMDEFESTYGLELTEEMREAIEAGVNSCGGAGFEEEVTSIILENCIGPFYVILDDLGVTTIEDKLAYCYGELPDIDEEDPPNCEGCSVGEATIVALDEIRALEMLDCAIEMLDEFTGVSPEGVRVALYIWRNIVYSCSWVYKVIVQTCKAISL